MSGLIRSAGRFFSKYGTKILTGTSIVGVITTTVSGIVATPKAMLRVDELRAQYGEDERVPKKELFKAVAPVYAPTAISGVLTIASIVCSEVLNSKQKAVLVGMASASEMALAKYQEKVQELFGDKARTVQDELNKEELAKNPVSENYVFSTGKGDSLCYDAWSGRYFTSDYGKLEQSVNEFNRLVISNIWESLNSWYELIGLPSVESGEDVGWNVDNFLECTYTSEFADDHRPCRVISFRHRPVKYYTR